MYLFALLCVISFTAVSIDGASCPLGFEFHGESCYFFSHGLETWIGAVDTCRLFGAELVEINSANEHNYIVSQLKPLISANSRGRWWIGLSDKQIENTWLWEGSNDIITDEAYTAWAPNEPDGVNRENCVFYGDDNGWADAECTRTVLYICESPAEASVIIG